ncbi:pepsinogen [Aphelenchoides avenae]|nr:pepsinogen [Aphelenchus avenae]
MYISRTVLIPSGVQQVSFGVFSNFRGAWNPKWSSDGVLGLLGPNPGDHTPHEAPRSTVQELAQKAGAGEANGGIVSFFLKGPRQVGEYVGRIKFGGLTDECANVKYAAPYANGPKDPWNFRVDSAHLGAVSQNNIGGKGLLGQSNIPLTMPNSTFAPFMAQIGATYDRHTGRYFVSCASAPALPTIQLTASGVHLYFTHADYVDQTNGGDKCEVLLSDSDDNSWTFGNKLWEKYCVVLDYVNARVGFSELPFIH